MSFIRSVFGALLELLGPISSIALGIWFIAALWYGFLLCLPFGIPFTDISMDFQGVRDMLIGGYIVIQALLTVDRYTMKFRGVQTPGRNVVELLFSLFPLGVLIIVLIQKQIGLFNGWGLEWGQSDNHLMILGLSAGIADILLTWLTWKKPATP